MTNNEQTVSFFWVSVAMLLIFFATGHGKSKPDLQDALIYKLTGERNWVKP
jgi:hypothetical protein